MTASPLLALDTSGSTARVALVAADGTRLAAGQRTGERHSAYLLPLCHELLTGAGLGPAGLGGLACGRGPGSFTGLRVGLAVAKGLALPFDLPLYLVSSLEALAVDLLAAGPGPAGPPPLLVPCIDAGKGEVYAQRFEPDGAGGVRSLGPEERVEPQTLASRLGAEGRSVRLAGSGADRHAAFFRGALGGAIEPGFPGPTADAVASLALARRARGEVDDLSAAVPSYGRPPDITKPRKAP